MRTLNSVSEFQTEAANAVFTKQQAISATLQLLTKEWNDPGNTPEEKSVLENAIQRAEFRYIDATKSGDGPYAGRYWRGALYYAGYRKRHSGDRIRCGVSPNLETLSLLDRAPPEGGAFACPETRKISPQLVWRLAGAYSAHTIFVWKRRDMLEKGSLQWRARVCLRSP